MDQDDQIDDKSIQGVNSASPATPPGNYSDGDIAKTDIIELLGFTTLPEENIKQMRMRLEEMVQNRVAARIHDTLTEIERNEWQKLLDAGDNEAVVDYLIQKNIDMVKWYAEEDLALKVELYEDSKNVRAKAKELLEEEEQNAAE